MSRKNGEKAKNENGISLLIISVAVLALCVALLVSCLQQQRKIRRYEESNAQLESEIQEQLERAEEIANLPEYIESDEYIEKIAREKFGMVYPDEIIFQAEN